MMRANFQRLISFFICLFASAGFAANGGDRVFQVATIGSLSQGVFDGDFTYGQLAQQGNFGLGTFLNLDGEMIALDGKFYRVEANGSVSRVRANEIVPFAEVVNFSPAYVGKYENINHYRHLSKVLTAKFNNQNIPFAIKIEGKFKKLKLRSLRKQQTPYPTLLQASQGQAVFDLQNEEGTIVGFWFPQYWAGITVPGLHLHFINKTRTSGGHVLELATGNVVISLQALHDVDVYLPSTGTFSRANLSDGGIIRSVKKAEGGV